MTSVGTASASVVIDASVWVSRLLQQDPNHVVASAWVDTHVLNGGHFMAPTLLAVEVAASVMRRTKVVADAHAAISQLNALSIMRLVSMDDNIVSEAAVIAANIGLRGADAVYVALAKQFGVPLVSFDTDHLTRASTIVQVIRPQ